MAIANPATTSTPATAAAGAAAPARAPTSTAAKAPVKKRATQAAAKSPVVKVVTGKAPVKKTAVKKPSVKKAAPQKVAAKAPLSRTAAPAKPKQAVKQKKPKLVRDSFTIPKAEYEVLAELKQRADKLTRPAKKSELLRAGIKILAALSDAALLTALAQVPTIKTGRPASKN